MDVSPSVECSPITKLTVSPDSNLDSSNLIHSLSSYPCLDSSSNQNFKLKTSAESGPIETHQVQIRQPYDPMF
jgi:hypothetical protein